jgi:hypothetical protein
LTNGLTMKKPLAILLTIALLISIVPLVNITSAAKTVSGIINSDTTWNDGSYTLTGPVGVKNGVTLTIEPGAIVEFASYYIQVNGTLNAQGTSNKNIIFKSSASGYSSSSVQNSIAFGESSSDWNDGSISGCVIQNAFFQEVSISITECSPKISRNTFNQTSIIVSSGSPIISYNYLYGKGATTAIQANGGSATISNNYLKGTGYQYGIIISGDTYLSNNVVDFCWDGIQISGQSTCIGNTVTNCYNAGISSSYNSVTISQNYIAYNRKVGITGLGDIESNTVVKNGIGIQNSVSSSSITLKNNNIYSNTNYDLFLIGSGNLDATNNYWGTTNSDSIAQKIFDSTDDFTLGTVAYTQFLSTPSLSAPSAPLVTIATPTPVPTADSRGYYPSSTPQPTLYSDWLASIGSSANGANSQLQGYIIQLSQYVLAGIAVGWALVIGMVLRKKSGRIAARRQKQ